MAIFSGTNSKVLVAGQEIPVERWEVSSTGTGSPVAMPPTQMELHFAGKREWPMTEAEWLVSTEPQKMLTFLQGHNANLAEGIGGGQPIRERKLRLFCCGCLRQVWDLLNNRWGHRCVELGEEIADDKVNAEAWHETDTVLVDEATAGSLDFAASWLGPEDTFSPRQVFANDGELRPWPEGSATRQAELLRCIVGNPFTPAFFDPGWAAVNGGRVRQLAEHIYEARDWEALPALHDALLEAGCEEQGLLEHLRGPGPHARGCHVLDLILEKE